MRFERTSSGGHAAINEVVEAVENLLAVLRRTSLGEKLAAEPHLRVLWNDAGQSEQVAIAAIVNVMGLPIERLRTPRAYRVGFGARVLEAVRQNIATPMKITMSLDPHEPYTVQKGDRVRSALKHLRALRLVEMDANGHYSIPAPKKPHPWSQRAVLPKRS